MRFGLMLASRIGKLLEMTVPRLLSMTDRTLIVLDNADQPTFDAVEGLKKTHPNLLSAYSGLPGTSPEEEKADRRQVFRRFVRMQGIVRDRAMRLAREHGCSDGDSVIWPDSDEMMTDFFLKAVEEMEKGGYTHILALPVDAYGDMSTLKQRSLNWHVRAFVMSPDVSAVPWRSRCRYNGLEKGKSVNSSSTVVHLAFLYADNREWRKEHWGNSSRKQEGVPFWKLGKCLLTASPDEILAKMTEEPSGLTLTE